MNGKHNIEVEENNEAKVNVEDSKNPPRVFNGNVVANSDPKPKSSRRPDIDVIRWLKSFL